VRPLGVLEGEGLQAEHFSKAMHHIFFPFCPHVLKGHFRFSRLREIKYSGTHANELTKALLAVVVVDIPRSGGHCATNNHQLSPPNVSQPLQSPSKLHSYFIPSAKTIKMEYFEIEIYANIFW
jgi:hypothetical protein